MILNIPKVIGGVNAHLTRMENYDLITFSNHDNGYLNSVKIRHSLLGRKFSDYEIEILEKLIKSGKSFTTDHLFENISSCINHLNSLVDT